MWVRMVCEGAWHLGVQAAGGMVTAMVMYVGPMEVYVVHVEEGIWGGVVVQSCMKIGLSTVAATLDLLKCQAHLEIYVGFKKGSNHSARRVEAG